MRVRHLVGLLSTLACVVPMTTREAGAQTIFTNTPILNGEIRRNGYTLSSSNWYIIGQTWRAPVVAAGQTLRLDDFTFWLYLGNDPALPPATFTARVHTWNGAVPQGPLVTDPTGPLLYESELRTGPAEGPGVTPYLFAPTGGLMVTPGAMYVTYLYAGPVTPPDPTLPGGYQTTSTRVAAEAGTRYLEGGQYLVSGSFGVESTGAPEMPETPFLAHFTTDGMSTVPEPSTYLLLGSGLAVLGAAARRRASSGRRRSPRP